MKPLSDVKITLSEINRRYGISTKQSNKLIDAAKLTLIQRGKANGLPTYVSLKSVESFISEKTAFLKEHVYARELIEELNLFSGSHLYSYIKNYEKLNEDFTQEEKGFLKAIKLPDSYYGDDVTVFFKRQHANKLKSDYININDAKELVGVTESMSKWLKRRKIQIFKFGNLRHQKFVRRDTILDGIANYERKTPVFTKERVIVEKDGYFTRNETMEMLKLSVNYLNKVVEEGFITPPIKYFNGTCVVYCYKGDEVFAFYEKQQKEFSELSELYYSRLEIKELYPNINLDTLPKTNGVKKVEFPYYLLSYVNTHDETTNQQVGKYLFNKNDIQAYNQSVTIRDSINADIMYSDPLDEFYRRLLVLRITFLPEAEITKKLWFEFAEEYLISREGNQEYVISQVIQVLTRTTEILADFSEKEIYQYNPNELNMSVMKNDEYPRYARELIYQYIVFVYKVITLRANLTSPNDKRRKHFNVEKLFNPRTLPHSKTEKKIYTEEEYSLLFKFASDFQKHKNKAINDALKFINNGFNLNTYKRYDSAWLYVLLHLNNAWRHSDCLHVPRISLEGTEIVDLNWLLENDISDEDAQKIIFRMKAADMIVSKTGAERHFFCAPQLEKAMATAIAICELRTRTYNDSLDTIIFKVHSKGQMAKGPKNAFFKSFPLKDFDFQNRAMNRTLITLIGYIQSQSGDAKDSEYLRILRDHVDFETTDIYIMIPQERLDEIALQLFDRDMFGHIPTVLAELLFGKTTDEKEKTEQVKAVKENFGDIYKIEETADFINNALSFHEAASQAFLTENKEYKDIVENIIRGMSLDELKSLHTRLITGQMPGKKKGYQCIVSQENCKFPGRDCDDCPLSIANFYALSSLVERIFQKVKVIEDSLKEALPFGERTRLANWLALDLDLLKYAQKKYGKQEISMFATGLNEKLKLINPNRQFQTIGKSEVS